MLQAVLQAAVMAVLQAAVMAVLQAAVMLQSDCQTVWL